MKGMAFTGEREKYIWIPSFVAHAVGYKTIVDAHNTVDVRCMWEIVSSSSGMADVGACHTVDAQMHAMIFSVLVWYGKCRRSEHC